jgi:hypothetical protein
VSRPTVAALADTASALAVTAWVGGIAALGAYSARIVFRDLPRETAAPTMNAIFTSFDTLIVLALVVLAAATVARVWAVGLAKRADRIALAAAVSLLFLGLLDVGYVHPAISRMFIEQRTLEPLFLALHKVSSRSANLEIAVSALLFGAQAFSRRES